MRARGGIEIGAAQYPFFIALHSAWLAAMLVFVPRDAVPNWWLLGLYALLQGLRLWTIASLGPYWTTRVIAVPGEPLVRTGPYRFLRHPNYVVVCGEIAVLPLAFGAIWIAIAFSILNAALLAWRVRLENASLTERAG